MADSMLTFNIFKIGPSTSSTDATNPVCKIDTHASPKISFTQFSKILGVIPSDDSFSRGFYAGLGHPIHSCICSSPPWIGKVDKIDSPPKKSSDLFKSFAALLNSFNEGGHLTFGVGQLNLEPGLANLNTTIPFNVLPINPCPNFELNLFNNLNSKRDLFGYYLTALNNLDPLELMASLYFSGR
jgi:hypothetical protein